MQSGPAFKEEAVSVAMSVVSKLATLWSSTLNEVLVFAEQDLITLGSTAAQRPHSNKA